MRDIGSSWVDVTTAAEPILLRLGRATKMFFAEVFPIKSRFVLSFWIQELMNIAASRDNP